MQSLPDAPQLASSHPVHQSCAERKRPAISRALAFAWPFLCRNLLFMELQSQGEAENCLLLSVPQPQPGAFSHKPSDPLNMVA